MTSLLVRPGVVALLLVLTAALLHPTVHSDAWLPQRQAFLAALLLLSTLALALRAATSTRASRLGAGLLAGGVGLVVVAVAGDGLQGHSGTVSLEPGQARSHFEEVGPRGRSLGLRPLGFTVGLEESLGGGGVALTLSGEPDPVALRPGRAVENEGVRLARPRLTTTGAASRLRVGVSGGGGDVSVDVTPGRPARVGELTLTLEEYFPDFALDDQRQPYTRSQEARNPGALLGVEGPAGRFRVFVLQAMPGVHRVEALDRAFSLLAVEPRVSVQIAVNRQPFAGLALLGTLLALAGVILDGRPA